MSPPSPEQMVQITTQADPVLRNLRITLAYWELSQAFTRWSGVAANWCTFATWASKQAGQTIRGEDLQRTLEHKLQVSPDIGDAVAQIIREARHAGVELGAGALRSRLLARLDPAAAFARASAAVSRGNTKVFAELGPLFARFTIKFNADEQPNPERLAEFLAGLQPGPPPDGQDLLRQAFTAYHNAGYADDRRHQLELTLFANLLIGQHEQTRLQPEIREALDASLGDRDELRARLLAAVLPSTWRRIRHQATRWLGQPLPLDRAIDRFIENVQRVARMVVTEVMMTLYFPDDTVLRLGRDLPIGFPAELQQLVLPELRTLLDRIDPTRDSVAGSGANDWSDLSERMHYIADLFRCYACHPPMFQSPFQPEQQRDLLEDRRPSGRL